MKLHISLAVLPLAASLALLLAPMDAAQAAPRDIQVLKSYVGEWKGRGTFAQGDAEETVVCRLNIADTAPTKVTFNGRCALAGTPPLAVRGTLAFIEASNRYEAVMSSNTSFSGDAIGRRRGDRIDFDLRERDPDTDSDLSIAVGFTLKNKRVFVDFKVTETSTGKSSTAVIPFDK